jgi:transposase
VGLLAKALEIEKLKLQIARLRRQQFGRSSEKIARTIEQLELMLEELEAQTPIPAAAVDSAPDAESSSASTQRTLPVSCKRLLTAAAQPGRRDCCSTAVCGQVWRHHRGDQAGPDVYFTSAADLVA